MLRHGMLSVGVCAGLTVLASGTARADVVSATVGAKAFAGGNLWTTPSNIPGGYNGIGFAGDGGGVGTEAACTSRVASCAISASSSESPTTAACSNAT